MLASKINAIGMDSVSDNILDDLYDEIDDLLLEGRFEYLDAELLSVQVNQVNTDLLLAMLTITLPARHKLVNRTRFFEVIKSTLAERVKNYDQMLVGLE